MNTKFVVDAARRHLSVCVAAILAASVAGASAAADAAIATPDVPADVISVDNCADSGDGSLRDAIDTAQSGDTIDLSLLTCSRISLTTGALQASQADLTLIGPGAARLTIDGSNQTGDAVIYHVGGGTLGISGLTITGGSKYRSDVDARGGCIHTDGNAELDHAVVTGCTVRGALSALGGGVFAAGQLSLVHSVVSDNSAYAAGSRYASGGGTYSLYGVYALYSTVSGNTVSTSTGTHSFGGAVFAHGPVKIYNSAITGNTSQHKIGGVAVYNEPGYNSFAVIGNSTISGNSADEIGGVLSVYDLFVYSSTIAFNRENVSNDGAGHYFAAGLQIPSHFNFVDGTIVSNNTASDRELDVSGDAGTIVGGHHDLIMTSSITVPVDTLAVDPELGPLTDNGGETRTHRALSSAVVNAGQNYDGVLFDQRGTHFPRTVDGAPDIGAYESDPDVILVNGFN